MCSYFFEGNHLYRIKASQKIALFLDFDGTLVPIQKDPSKCFLSEDIKKQLKLLAHSKNIYLTIISGRSLSDIKKRVGLRKICYGGNHGFDISCPSLRYTHPKALSAKPIINHVKQQLQKEIKNIKGAFLEDKGYSLSLHFRSVKEEYIHPLKIIFYKKVKGFLKKKLLTVMRGKMVLELIPDASWNKGKAVLYILRRLGKDYLPIYIGDDQTDETAFETLKKSGITIQVGKSKKTSARYYLKDYREVSQLLQQIQQWH
ncbi:MAG: trehalose-phosphatase [Thermodesulfovibrionales bacterium]